MKSLTFKYLYPVNKENLVELSIHSDVRDVQINIRINKNVTIKYYLNRFVDYNTTLSHNELKIAHQIVDVLNSVKRYVRRAQVRKSNSWELTKNGYNNAFYCLGNKTTNFQKYNKNYILSIILANPFFTSNLLKTMKFYLMRREYGPLVIGIHGTKGAGKTTLAKAIVGELECNPNTAHRSSIYHFADPLKKATSELLGVSVEALEHLKNKGEHIQGSLFTHREFLQHLGTDFMQSISKDWIINLSEKYLNEVYKHINVVVIPDVRFEHEAKFIKEKCNGILIKLSREGHVVNDNHASEQPIDNCIFDAVVKVATKQDSLVAANYVINTYTYT